ncbi:MAG: hypothetical protein ACE5FC_06165 [Myxococcota bacterium]
MVAALFSLALLAGPPVTLAQGPAAPGVVFGKPFWNQWKDGKAELAAYDLTIPRYGQIRKGVAVTIVIPETFSNALRVKADRGKHPAFDTYPVLKLNLIEDFPTGIYDYNLMTSVFTTMAGVPGRPAGSATKISFSAQEWCGHAWTQFLFDAAGVRYTGHSYFDGEADDAVTLDYPGDGIAEDALLLWARGWAAPLVPPGDKREVSLLTSARLSRFGHTKPKWERAVLAHSAKAREVVVPAGTFQTDLFTVAVKSGRRWSFYVEQGGMRRVVKWESGEGEVGELVSSERHKYWEMNGRRFVPALEGLGLSARPPRTP